MIWVHFSIGYVFSNFKMLEKMIESMVTKMMQSSLENSSQKAAGTLAWITLKLGKKNNTLQVSSA